MPITQLTYSPIKAQPESGTRYDIRHTVSQCVNEDVALGGSGSAAFTTEVAEKFRIAARNL